MGECLARVKEYTQGERTRFEGSRLVQDAVMRNLQTLTESSQRLSAEIKATEPQIPWRELAGGLSQRHRPWLSGCRPGGRVAGRRA
jgi:uncharacterized protein with HEPN domain